MWLWSIYQLDQQKSKRNSDIQSDWSDLNIAFINKCWGNEIQNEWCDYQIRPIDWRTIYIDPRVN